jgi:hypothetical protein
MTRIMAAMRKNMVRITLISVIHEPRDEPPDDSGSTYA